MTYRLTPFALAMLALAAPGLRAQTVAAAATDTEPQRVEVTGQAATKLDVRPASTSRLGLSLRETPATVTAVDRAAIDAMGARDTQEILKAIPGVTYSSQPGSAGSVFYRGFGSSSLAQLYNGITVQYDAISARAVDSWLVERVEAMGGPSSFLHGSGAVGGSINVITKVADRQGDLSQGRAAVGEQRQLALDVQRTLGADGHAGHVLRLDLNATQGTWWTQGDDRKTWQAGASWLAPLGGALTHTLSLERQHERVTQPYWGTPALRDAGNAVLGQVEFDRRTLGVNYNVVDGRYQQDVTWARSILAWDITPAARLTHTLYHYDALRDYDNVETYTFVNANTQVQRSNALLQRHDQQVWGSRGEATLRGAPGGVKSDFAFGWDWSYNTQTRFPLSVAGPFDTTDPYRPADTHFLQTPGITRTYTPGATNQLRTLALFVENRTVLAPNWALTGGLRADRIALTVTNHRAVTATNPRTFDTGFKPLTGRLGLVHDLTPTWQVYAQVSTAADPPSGLLATAGFSALRDFDLTRGRQVELGSKGSFDGGRGEATLALYEIHRKNLSMTDPLDRTRVIPIGAQSSRGVELAASWKPAGAWLLAGFLTYTDAQYDDLFESTGTGTVSRKGNRPSNVPDWVAGAAATWQPVPAWTAALDWRHVGKRFGNTANTVWDGAYDVFGIGLAWRWSPQLKFSLRVDNLADTSYAQTVGANLSVLGRPRTTQLQADLQF
jgi:iron complex outermembrane receptor protein